MDFFQAQDSARRKTWQLALIFALAVISLIVLTNLLVAAVYVWSGNYTGATGQSLTDEVSRLPTHLWVLISAGVISMVGVASLYKYLTLRGGGRAIAELMGGRLLTYEAADPKARRLLNVVEEMAIAAGISVPPVYLIDEPSINAFAAGLTPDDAVIGINQGTIDQLSRDELQGVVAHEFSHILNGDTRINLRLIAILHGIVFLSMIGYVVLRGFGLGHGSRRSSGGSNSAAPIIALGVGLLVIGYAGNFFGNLIKAAVSRQREYLADAAAVQFTRSQTGIADALKKIGGLSVGSTMTAASATQASHMFFGQIQPMFLSNILATHPPLEKRIRAIQPGWDGKFIEGNVSPDPMPATPQSPAEQAAAGFAGAQSWSTGSIQTELAPEALVAQVGSLSDASLEAAHSIISSTDETLREAAHDAWGSRAIIYGLLLDADPEIHKTQLNHLARNAEPGVPEYTAKLAPLLEGLDATHKLVLVDMANPALKSLSNAQYRRFVDNTIALIKMDRKIELLEWVLHRVLVKELKPHFEGPSRVRTRYKNVSAVAEHAQVLLSTLAWTGHPEDGTQAQKAFAAGALSIGLELDLQPAHDPNFALLNRALGELRKLRPLAMPQLLKACAVTALNDHILTPREGALLHGVAATLDCPLPPSIYKDLRE